MIKLKDREKEKHTIKTKKSDHMIMNYIKEQHTKKNTQTGSRNWDKGNRTKICLNCTDINTQGNKIGEQKTYRSLEQIEKRARQRDCVLFPQQISKKSKRHVSRLMILAHPMAEKTDFQKKKTQLILYMLKQKLNK